MSREYRYEALCQICWQQFELPDELAEHVCRNCKDRPVEVRVKVEESGTEFDRGQPVIIRILKPTSSVAISRLN